MSKGYMPSRKKKYSKDIEEEEKGAEHYENLSEKDKKNKKKFLSMAKDEEKHESYLKKMK